MGHKPQGPDVFTLKDGYVECISGSGHTYKITHNSCSCSGFGFRKTCRHYTQAKQKGLLDQLETQIVTAPTFKSNEYIKQTRMDAIRAWLTKENLNYKPEDVVNIEKMMTEKTTLQEIMALFF